MKVKERKINIKEIKERQLKRKEIKPKFSHPNYHTVTKGDSAEAHRPREPVSPRCAPRPFF